MILGKNGRYRCYGVLAAAPKHVGYREYSRFSPGGWNHLHTLGNEESAEDFLSATVNSLIECGWEVIPLGVLQAQVGMGATLNPYAGLKPMVSASGAEAEAVSKVRSIALREEAERLAAEAERAKVERELREAQRKEQAEVERAALAWAANLTVAPAAGPTEPYDKGNRVKLVGPKREGLLSEKEREEAEGRGVNPDLIERMKGLELD